MNTKTATLLTVLAVIIFSTDNMVLKSVPDELSGFVAIAFATLFAAPILTVIFWKKAKERVSKKSWKLVALASVFYVMYAGCNALAVKWMSADQAAFLFSTAVVFVPVLDLIFLGNKVRSSAVVWLAIIIGGVWLASDTTYMTDGIGVTLSLSAAIFRAAFILVQNRSVRDIGTPRYMVRMTWCCALLAMTVVLVAVPEIFTDGSMKLESFTWIFVFAISSLTVATSLYVFAQEALSAFRTALIFSTQIVFTVIISALLPESTGMHTGIDIWMVLGMVMIIAGTVFASIDFKEVREMYLKRKNGRDKPEC